MPIAGIRQIELDVAQDPNGGLFATAAGLKLAGGNGTLADPQYMQPGWKVDQGLGLSSESIICMIVLRMRSDSVPLTVSDLGRRKPWTATCEG